MDAFHPISRPFKMKNTIQTYAWGSYSAIPQLLGQAFPSSKPQAELWIGAHPKAPSLLWFQGRWQALDQLISQYPDALLGRTVVNRFGTQLPFLLKILAAEQPLSIQAHPDKAQAKAGFLRENDEGIDLSAAHRNYRDPQHKPECLCALTPFEGLCGFRSLSDMMSLMGSVWPMQYNNLMTALTKEGTQSFFEQIMNLPPKTSLELVSGSVDKASASIDINPAFSWMVRLNELFPGDIGVLAPLFLNMIKLQPEEAIFLPARQLHGYLNGVGVEVMANSDNVLRGGLTPKHIDVPELLRVLDFTPHKPDILTAEGNGSAGCIFPSKVEEFELSILHTQDGRSDTLNLESDSVCILLCTRGSAVLRYHRNEKVAAVRTGESLLIPAALTDCALSGKATIFRATVNTKILRK